MADNENPSLPRYPSLQPSSLVPYLPASPITQTSSPPPPPPPPAPGEPTPLIVTLERILDRGKKLRNLPKVPPGQAALINSAVRSSLEKLYGKGALEIEQFPQVTIQHAIELLP